MKNQSVTLLLVIWLLVVHQTVFFTCLLSLMRQASLLTFKCSTKSVQKFQTFAIWHLQVELICTTLTTQAVFLQFRLNLQRKTFLICHLLLQQAKQLAKILKVHILRIQMQFVLLIIHTVKQVVLQSFGVILLKTVV